MSIDKRPLLLDTHCWLWLAAADWTKFSPREKRAIEAAALAGGLRLSMISIWEAGVLESKARIRIKEPAEAWLKRVCGLPGLLVAEMTVEIAWDSSHLPGVFHGDPADRIIVATARALGARLLTRDAAILEYAESRYVEVID